MPNWGRIYSKGAMRAGFDHKSVDQNRGEVRASERSTRMNEAIAVNMRGIIDI